MRQDCLGDCSSCSCRGSAGCSFWFDVVLKTDSSGAVIPQKRGDLAERCKVVSHRGLSHSAPENTLSSVVESIQVGADYCEFDVRMTADGHVILMHDSTLDRTTNGSGFVDQMTFDEIAGLDAGSWKGDKYVGERVATLDAVLERIKPTQQNPLIEIKDELAWREVVECVRGHAMEGRAVLLSPDEQVLKLIGNQEGLFQRAYLCELFPNDVRNIPDKVEWLCGVSERVGVDIIDIDYRFLSAEMIAGLHQRGVEVWTWTVNSPEIMKCLIKWGVDAISSDRPDLLRELLSEQ